MPRQRFIFISLLVLIFIRFAYLNWINWDSGELTTGKAGVQWWVDSYRYMESAKDLIAGEGVHGRATQYLGYILLLVLAIKTSLESLILIQLSLALLAAYLLYDLTKLISGSQWAGLLAAGLYLANPFITTWHLFLLTESPYTSMLIICVWAMYNAYEIPSMKWYVTAFGLILITALLRPNGWVLFPVWGCFIVVRHVRSLAWQWIGSFAVVLGFLMLSALNPSVNRSIQKSSPVEMLVKGEVVYNHPELRLQMPQEKHVAKNWVGALTYVIKHPMASVRLGVTRVYTMFKQTRPFHSTKYQIRILIWILPAYLLALFGMWAQSRHPGARIVFWVIFGHALTVALTYATHESRFVIYILPLVYVFSGFGLAYLLQMLKIAR